MTNQEAVEESELETMRIALDGARERATVAESRVAELETRVASLKAELATAMEDSNAQRVKQLKRQMYNVFEALEEASRHPECKLAKDAVEYLKLK